MDSAFPFDRGGLEPVGKGRRGKGAEARAAAGGWKEDNAGGQLGKFPQMDFLKMCCVVVMDDGGVVYSLNERLLDNGAQVDDGTIDTRCLE